MRRFCSAPFSFVAAWLLAACAGCGDPPAATPVEGTGTGETGPAAQQASAGPLRFTIDDLPAATRLLPPLDEGRLRVTHPKNWRGMPRSRDYVAGLSQDGTEKPPRIVIMAADEPDSPIANAAPENLDTFAAFMKQRVADQLTEGQKLLEPVQPVVLGERAFVQYMRPIVFNIGGKSIAGERLILETIAGGRLYTLELQTYTAGAHKIERDAYSVAASLEFPGAN